MGEGEMIEKVRSRIGSEVPELVVRRALSESGFDPDAAVKFLNDNPGFLARPVTVVRAITSTGSRVLAPIKQEEMDDSQSFDGMNLKIKLKEEIVDLGFENQKPAKAETGSDDSELAQPLEGLNLKKELKEEVDVESEKQDSVKKEMGSDGFACKRKSSFETSFDEFLKATDTKVMSEDEIRNSNVKQEPSIQADGPKKVKQELSSGTRVKEAVEEVNVKSEKQDSVKKEMGSDGSTCKRKSSWETKFDEFLKATDTKVMSEDECRNSNVKQEPSIQAEGPKKVKQELNSGTRVKEEAVTSDFNERKILKDYIPDFLKPLRVKKERVEDKVLNVEDGDFPEDPDWFLVGRKIVTALSTTKGRKLVDNEIVHFNFPHPAARFNSQWIVRISTKRSGEVGRLPMEWAKLVIPLVRSSKVIVKGRCVAVPPVLQMMQQIMLSVSFYIHHTVFSSSEVNTSWRLDASTYIDPTVFPLPTLFRLLEMKPYQNADFTPEELDSRKRWLNLGGNSDEAASDLPVLKRRKGCPPDQDNDEQAMSQSSLNKLVGAAEVYDLEEMDPPSTLMCHLKPYQKQALFWMSKLEKGTDVENAASTLHPCWAAYCINDERASSIYVNNFTGEATIQLPPAAQMARGGILADAMGLGKTVMSIALILARQGRGDNTGLTRKRKQDSHTNPLFKADGGTLIVCPMALLGQWKDELETHSEPGSISIFVHYGGDRTNDPRVISGHDVVLTTYGVLAAAYKSCGENSIYHRVNWHRVVLDEAHTIKAYKTHAAQAAFTLSSHCRWCLTGTPLQNNLEDLFSLLCFLHVEPWCNFAWFNKLIQRPYENGDPRGLKLVKAILRPLMLRRTKETKDKFGRPILVLPPTDIQLVECEQSDAESVFYNALFRKSKTQFDQYVAQGKVLHNYANILELLLRLRQCCNHPFLVTSRTDSKKKPVDLDKLSRRFLEFNSINQTIPSCAYIEEVIENIRKGEKIECPICMESADDPVFTPCAHRMCRECLLSSWRTPISGPCPLCRQMLNRTDLINCPFENQFMVADVEKDWKESSKVSKLLEYLKHIQHHLTGEKSIVFSQWPSFLDLLEIPLKRKEIGYLRYDGSLAQKQRERILKEFNETSEKRVLLMSLKAGGVGLNLTAASNVFIMDPWWNPAVEEQAIMRIHRIGQKRKVVVRRFIVKDTVEERLQQVQAKKQRMISGALTDEEVRSARIDDLKMLFR